MSQPHKKLTYRQYEKIFKTRFFEIINAVLDESIGVGGRINMFSVLKQHISYPEVGWCKNLISEAMTWLQERQSMHQALLDFNFGFEIREFTYKDGTPTGLGTIIMWFSKDWPALNH
jgi:hypothetical protein